MLSNKGVELSRLVESARYMLYKAAYGFDNNDRNPLNIWKSRVYCIDAALRVKELTQRIFASYGYSEEYHVATLIKDIQGSKDSLLPAIVQSDISKKAF